MSAPTELWRSVPGQWRGLYEISNSGRVRGVARTIRDRNGHPRRVPGRVLILSVPDEPHHGAPRCTLASPGRRETVYPHRLMRQVWPA